MRTLQKTIGISVTIAGLLALLIMSGCTGQPPPTPVPTGSLEGVVSDASTGAPVAGVQVTIAGQTGVFTLATGADGKYKVGSLAVGSYLVSAQATGYYAGVTQVGVVAKVVSSGDVSLEPAGIAIVAATPTAPPAVPSPTPIVITVVVTPPPTPVPTSTPTPLPTPTPIPAPARGAASTGSGSRAAHAAPVLLEPHDGAAFHGPQEITFRWLECCGRLAADEYYVVSIPHPQGVEEAWVKTTTWKSPDYLYLLVPPSRKLTWNVSVRRHMGEYPNGQWKGPIISSISETWHFAWYKDGGRISPLAAPVSPLAPPGP